MWGNRSTAISAAAAAAIYTVCADAAKKGHESRALRPRGCTRPSEDGLPDQTSVKRLGAVIILHVSLGYNGGRGLEYVHAIGALSRGWYCFLGRATELVPG